MGEETTAGNQFVSNYPPFSFWSLHHVEEAVRALDRLPASGSALGVYVHIPFCRKRCYFCSYKVYTDKKAAEIQDYLGAVIQELEIYSRRACFSGRKPRFIYFGGGTPSYLSTRQLIPLVEAMERLLPWDEAEEVTFECEPGTLTEGKLGMLKDLGVTRLSLGIENFDPEILKINGRAHGSKEIDRAWQFARSVGFPQINIDLLAGMLGETNGNWAECVRRTLELAPDSVTIYQMDVPYNTAFFKEMKAGRVAAAALAGPRTKREWVRYAFTELEKAGYTVDSAYTAVRDPARTRFLYRDLLWSGADMIGLGVASFSHLDGVHFQNDRDFGSYTGKLRHGELPISRALIASPEERMIRELILHMKLGRVRASYFQSKFGVDVRQRFSGVLQELQEKELLVPGDDGLRLNRDGLLRVDSLLPEFFLPKHRSATQP